MAQQTAQPSLYLQQFPVPPSSSEGDTGRLRRTLHTHASLRVTLPERSTELRKTERFMAAGRLPLFFKPAHYSNTFEETV